VGELAGLFLVSWPAVTKHVRVLQNAGLLEQRRDGRIRRCRLRPKPMREAAAWLDRYRRLWSGQLDGLAEFLEGASETSAARPRRKKLEKNG